MAQRGQDLLSRLADRGEEAIQRLGEVPGAHRFVDAATGLRERVDELQKRVRGIDEIERRVKALEQRVDKLDGGSATAKRSGARKTGSAAKPKSRTSTKGAATAAKAVRKGSTRKTSS